MKSADRIKYIVKWIKDYCSFMDKKPDCLVVGVSGGIDSAVVSTLSAMTGMNMKVLSMSSRQLKSLDDLSKAQIQWLKIKFKNVDGIIVNLDDAFKAFEKKL
jgi:NAD+ synthase